VKSYTESLQVKSKEERKSDIYTKLIAYPPPNDFAAQSAPQYAFRRILLAKSKSPYPATDDKMSLYHAREYFCNALYAIDIWKDFFSEKRASFLGKTTMEEGKNEESKTEKFMKAAGNKGSQENMSKVKLESLVNLVLFIR